MRLGLAAVAALPLAGCVFGYCSRLDPVDSTESITPEAAVLASSVAVLPFYRSGQDQPYDSDDLIRVLRDTRLFGIVDRYGRVEHPDLVVRLEERIQEANACIPAFTAMTLGIFPTFVDGTYGFDLTIYRAEAPAQATHVSYRRQSTEVFGLIANVLLLFPGYHFSGPDESDEFSNGLRSRLWGTRIQLDEGKPAPTRPGG